MAMVLYPPHAAPDGSYVVRGPARTDAIGHILRASFSANDEQAEEMKRLLALLDHPIRSA